MKKMILLTSFAFSAVYCENSCPNNIYFGPEAFVFDLNSHFKGVKVEGTKFFIGLKLGYEFIKPQSFYFGAQLLSARGNKGFNDSFKHYHFQKPYCDTGFGNVEFRFGYTLANEERQVIPFLGFGSYAFGYGSHHHRYDQVFGYLTGGFFYKWKVSPIFNVGLNAKIFVSYLNDASFKFWDIKRHNHHGLWGGEMSVPLIWYLGSTKRWDIQLEPYFLKLDFSQVLNIYGTRLLFGYRF